MVVYLNQILKYTFHIIDVCLSCNLNMKLFACLKRLLCLQDFLCVWTRLQKRVRFQFGPISQ